MEILFENFNNKRKNDLDDFFIKEIEYAKARVKLENNIKDIVLFLFENKVEGIDTRDIEMRKTEIIYYFNEEYSEVEDIRYVKKKDDLILEFTIEGSYYGLYLPLDFYYNFDTYKDKHKFGL